METEFAILQQTRNNIQTLLEEISDKDLVRIPADFSNNIYWNVAHIVIVQQLLCNKMSRVPLNIPDEWVAPFSKGSAPDGTCDAAPRAGIQEALTTTVEALVDDYRAGRFGAYKTYPTSYGFTIASIEDAIAFNNVHEALHLGYILALKRALRI